MVLQELDGHDAVTVVFDDNAHVWDKNWGNLIPIPPYCYWQGEDYWDDKYLNSRSLVLHTFDEHIANGPLCVAWNTTLSLLSEVIARTPQPPPTIGVATTSNQPPDITLVLEDRRRQVSWHCC